MKTMIKICGKLAALTAVLLVTAVLVTSCVEPISSFQPPEGMGSIRFIINGNTGRSIVPGSPSFTQYVLTFQPYTDNNYDTVAPPPAAAQTETIAVGDIDDPINLLPGFYKVTVVGQTGTNAPAQVGPPAVPADPYINAAEGESAGFQIQAGVNNSALTVIIKPYAYDDTGTTTTGKFTYTLNLSGLTAVTTENSATQTPRLQIKSLMGKPYTDSDVQAGTGSSQLVLLPAGFYSVEYVLTTANGTARSYDILHIYQGLTSNFSYTFSAAQFPAGGTGIIDPDYQGPSDTKPTLTKPNPAAGTVVDETTVIELTKENPPTAPALHTETVTLGNAGSYSSVVWRINGIQMTVGPELSAGNVLTIVAGANSFDVSREYEIIVVGTIATGVNAGVYGTKFKVLITD